MAGGQRYGLRSYTVPGDFSSASYPLAAAAITGSHLEVKGILPSRQGDSAIIDILDRMGAKISWERDLGVVSVTGRELHGVDVDASLTPDLVPTGCCPRSARRGTDKLFTTQNTSAYKEYRQAPCDGIELSKDGDQRSRERPDGLEIEGCKLHGARVCGYHDHRIVMALAVAGLAVGGTEIDTAESVDVSFPGFFQEMARLGGRFELSSS